MLYDIKYMWNLKKQTNKVIETVKRLLVVRGKRWTMRSSEVRKPSWFESQLHRLLAVWPSAGAQHLGACLLLADMGIHNTDARLAKERCQDRP